MESVYLAASYFSISPVAFVDGFLSSKKSPERNWAFLCRLFMLPLFGTNFVLISVNVAKLAHIDLVAYYKSSCYIYLILRLLLL